MPPNFIVINVFIFFMEPIARLYGVAVAAPAFAFLEYLGLHESACGQLLELPDLKVASRRNRKKRLSSKRQPPG